MFVFCYQKNYFKLYTIFILHSLVRVIFQLIERLSKPVVATMNMKTYINMKT